MEPRSFIVPPRRGGKVVAPATKGGKHFLARRAIVWFSPPKAAFILAPPRAPTSPAGTVSQPIGKPFNGQAKGLLWLTWRSYAGPPQYFIPPEGESPQPACKAKPITGRTLAAQGQRPGGCLNPHARKGVSTFGNTGKHRHGPSSSLISSVPRRSRGADRYTLQ